MGSGRRRARRTRPKVPVLRDGREGLVESGGGIEKGRRDAPESVKHVKVSKRQTEIFSFPAHFRRPRRRSRSSVSVRPTLLLLCLRFRLRLIKRLVQSQPAPLRPDVHSEKLLLSSRSASTSSRHLQRLRRRRREVHGGRVGGEAGSGSCEGGKGIVGRGEGQARATDGGEGGSTESGLRGHGGVVVHRRRVLWEKRTGQYVVVKALLQAFSSSKSSLLLLLILSHPSYSSLVPARSSGGLTTATGRRRKPSPRLVPLRSSIILLLAPLRLIPRCSLCSAS